MNRRKRNRKIKRGTSRKSPRFQSNLIDPNKTELRPMTAAQKLEVTTSYADDVIAKLCSAFVDVVQKEHWGKRDLSRISGINESQIGHILSGRRKNLTNETVALLARSMRMRPELLLHDIRPVGNMTVTCINDVVAVSTQSFESIQEALRKYSAAEASSSHSITSVAKGKLSDIEQQRQQPVRLPSVVHAH